MISLRLSTVVELAGEMKLNSTIIACLILILSGSTYAADLIPADRTNAWGNWIYRPPTVAELRARTVHASYGSGSPPTVSALNSAIAACASNSIILLTNNGTTQFTLAGRVILDKDGVFVVGETNATGQPNVVINNTGVDTGAVVDMFYISKGQGSSGDIFAGQTAFDVWTNTISRVQKGSTSIATKTTPTGIAIGDIITIDQLEGDAAGLVESDGNSGSGSWLGRESGNRSFAQPLLVTNITDGTNIHFEPPIYLDFNIAQTIQVCEQPSILRNAGIANVVLTNTGGVSDTISMHGAHRTGLLNCKLYHSDRRHVWEFGGSQTYYINSDFRYGVGADWGVGYTSDQGYGVFLGQNGGFSLVEGCVFEKQSFPIALEGARMGDVIGYNFATNIMTDSEIGAKPFTGNHGSHPGNALFEGNWAAGRISMDHYWGSSSHWLFLRDRFFIVTNQNGTMVSQYAVVMDLWTNNVYHTMIGCILGIDGTENKLHVPSGGSVNEGSTDKNIYRMGALDANHTTWSQYDPTVSNTFHRSVNWLSRTNTSVSGTGIEYGDGITDTNPPASLYLTSKHPSQGILKWPAIDPFAGPESPTNIWPGHRFYFGTNPPAPQTVVAGTIPASAGAGKLRSGFIR